MLTKKFAQLRARTLGCFSICTIVNTTAQEVEIAQVILLDDQLSTVQLVIALVVPAIVRDSLQARAPSSGRLILQPPSILMSSHETTSARTGT
eukprot:COSAG02_NODE_27189_length_615_cov_1.094961_2_plen_93_part_00